MRWDEINKVREKDPFGCCLVQANTLDSYLRVYPAGVVCK